MDEFLQRSHIVETEPFGETFGPKAQRKKARIEVGTFEELGKLGAAAAEEAELRGDTIVGPSSTYIREIENAHD